MSKPVRVRIAPSPTGNLHVGTARSALYNLLFARRHGGAFIFRLEDTDEQRSDEVYTKDMIEGLHWLGIAWDEGVDIGGPCKPYRQTEKIDHYNTIANKLISQGAAYFCYCSPEELMKLKEEQGRAGLPPRYDNRCRELTPDQVKHHQAEGRIPVIRFKIEEPRIVQWNDAIRDSISVDTSGLGGDLVIIKSSGVASYNFAVVVDDLDMNISHVIRGEEHIHNGAKQLLIYEALGKTPPVFAHVALMVDTDRRKLSKRFHGEAVHVSKYRKDGYLPEALMNYLIQMSWTHPEGLEIFSLENACAVFDLARLSKSPAVFDIQRLNWFNGHYIRSLPLEDIAERARPFLADFDLSMYDEEAYKQIVSCVREGLTTLSEIKEATRFFFVNDVEIPAEVKATALTDDSSKVLTSVLGELPRMPWGDRSACKARVDDVGKSLQLKGKQLYWPLRAALSGSTSGPDFGSMISILGDRRVKHRLEAALTKLSLN